MTEMTYLQEPTMKKTFLIVFVLFISFQPYQTWAADTPIDWIAIKVAFQKYVNHPSSKNAAQIISILPGYHLDRAKYADSKERNDTINYIWETKHSMEILERKVLSKDRESVRLVFRLIAISDGAFSENLDIILGKLITIEPILYLEELKLSISLGCDRWNISNYGPGFVDRFETICRETKRRIKALMRVKDPSLISLRNKLIESLNKRLKDECK